MEKWFAESLSNSWATVAAKEEELNSELQQHLLLHQQRQENIETNIYNVRAGTYFFTLSTTCLHSEMIIGGPKSVSVLGVSVVDDYRMTVLILSTMLLIFF